MNSPGYTGSVNNSGGTLEDISSVENNSGGTLENNSGDILENEQLVLILARVG